MTRVMKNPYRCSCAKRCFKLRDIKILATKYAKKHGYHLEYYRCPILPAWHLTHKTAKAPR